MACMCVLQGEERLLGERRTLNCILKAEKSRLWVDSENRAGVPGTADAGGELGLSREGSAHEGLDRGAGRGRCRPPRESCPGDVCWGRVSFTPSRLPGHWVEPVAPSGANGRRPRSTAPCTGRGALGGGLGRTGPVTGGGDPGRGASGGREGAHCGHLGLCSRPAPFEVAGGLGIWAVVSGSESGRQVWESSGTEAGVLRWGRSQA